MSRMVLMAEVSGGRVRGRQRLGWMVALGNRGMTVEAARQCSKDRKEWRSLGTHVTEWVSRGYFLPGAVFFRTALPCSGGYHMERGGINCKKGATTENQDSAVKYIKTRLSQLSRGVSWWLCVCFIWLDMIKHTHSVNNNINTILL